MNEQAKELAAQFDRFNRGLISFVEACSEEDWKKETAEEKWSVGVVARHVAAGHYGAMEFAKKIITDEPLPDLTMDAINQMNAQHASEHAECTKSEVLELLKKNGSSITGFVEELSEAELDRTGHMELTGGAISTRQFIENIILQSGGEHFDNMKKATGKS